MHTLYKLILQDQEEKKIMEFIDVTHGCEGFIDLLNYRDNSKNIINTPLELCISRRYYDAALKILENNYNEFIDNCVIIWETIISFGCCTQEEYEKGKKFLCTILKYQDPEYVNNYREPVIGNPIFDAVRIKNHEILGIMLKFGCKTEIMIKGLTPLMYAIIYGNQGHIEILVSYCADIMAETKFGDNDVQPYGVPFIIPNGINSIQLAKMYVDYYSEFAEHTENMKQNIEIEKKIKKYQQIYDFLTTRWI